MVLLFGAVPTAVVGAGPVMTTELDLARRLDDGAVPPAITEVDGGLVPSVVLWRGPIPAGSGVALGL